MTIGARRRQPSNEELLAEVGKVREVATAIRREIGRGEAASTARQADSLLDRVTELENQMSLRFSGNGGVKA